MYDANVAKSSVHASSNLPEIFYGLKRRQPPVQELAQMSRNLGVIFEKGGPYRSVLYIGANKRRQYFLDWFERAGYARIVVMEAFKENVEFLKAEIDRRMPSLEVVHGDVRNPSDMPDRFDVAFFWHGHEHLREEEITPALKNLEAISRVVVLGCPHGIYMQGAEYGNPFEEHLSAVHPWFLERLGYETDTIGKADEQSSNILAWKFTGRASSTSGGEES